MTTERLKVLLADDHELFREGLKALFDKHGRWTVCGEASDGEAAVALAVERKPDLIVLDLSMPRMNGLQAAKAIRQLAPESKIVMLSMHGGAAVTEFALRAGVDLYLEKSDASDELFTKIDALFDGAQPTVL